jgi:hypothetical protein
MFAAALRIYYGWQNSKRDTAEKMERETGDVKEVVNIEWLNRVFMIYPPKRFSDSETQ